MTGAKASGQLHGLGSPQEQFSPSATLAEILLGKVSRSEQAEVVLDVTAKLSALDPDESALFTASLLAELLRRVDLPVENASLNSCRIRLVMFLCQAIKAFHEQDNIQPLRQIVELIQHDDWIICTLFWLSKQRLQDAVDIVLADEESEPLALRRSELFAIFGVLEQHCPTDPSICPHERLDVSFEVSAALTFLKVLFWCAPKSILRPWQHGFFVLLLMMSLKTDKSHTEASKQALFAIIESYNRSSDMPTGLSNSEFLPPSNSLREVWKIILSTAEESTNSFTNDGSAILIWLRLLASPSPWSPVPGALNEQLYWEIIENVLAYGTQEQRKMVLSILSLSLTHAQQDIETPTFSLRISERIDFELQYERYITVFETIVQGRYLNQVQECLGDLQSLASKESKVHRSLLFALLTAALSNKMQESIRKTVGNWIMNGAHRHLANTGHELSRFAVKSFFPWAIQGNLCVSTTRKDRSGRITCSHGQQLSECIQHMIANMTNSQDQLNMIKAILKFLSSAGRYIFPYSRAYVLEGLIAGVGLSKADLDPAYVQLVLEVFSYSTNFAEVVKDLSIAQCMALVSSSAPHITKQCIEPLTQAQTALTRRQVATRRDPYAIALDFFSTKHSTEVEAINNFPRAPEDTPSINPFVCLLRKTQSRCLRGKGLQAACNYLERVLWINLQDESEVDELAIILEAIWDEAQVQDFPKRILLQLPGIILHQKCIRLSPTSSKLAHVVKKMFEKLQSLSENRVYLFSPLASAMRSSVLCNAEGSRFLFNEFVTSFAMKPPVTRVEFELEAVMASKLSHFVPGSTYESYYGKKEGFGYACVFDMLNNLSNDYLQQTYHIVDALLEPWINQTQPIPVFSKWKRTVQLQILVILCENCLTKEAGSKIDHYLTVFLDIMSIEPLPRYRFLFEWIIARIFVRIPDRRNDLLKILSSLDMFNPKHSVSVLKIALMVARLQDTDLEYSLELMTQLVPLTACPKIVIRHEAQWIVPVLWDHAIQNGWSVITENPAFSRLNSWIREADIFKNPPPGRLQEAFDPVLNHTLTDLFQGEYLRIDPVEEESTTRDYFQLVQNESLPAVDSLEQLSRPLLILGEKKRYQLTADLKGNTYVAASDTSPGQTAGTVPLQTKRMARLSDLATSTIFSSETSGRRSKSLIIVASLLDNPYNLGGLSRISEIFGAQCLYMRSLKVTKNRDFTSVAVSSQLHFAMEELDVPDIPAFLAKQKLQGWTVVGIEQTDSSKVLGNAECVLPEKTVLVIGGEQKGIPGELLSLMDLCVEIRQFGVTRSMNVQTAAAVVLYEYAKQHP